jgi:luciferase family oxidoreductase group 1
VKLSVLDVMPIASGHSAADALRGASDLARLADQCGYTRLWYAEHHGMATIASTSPELLIAHVGGVTERIRLGAGGVMLPNHVPLRVVEQYRTLHALHPDRIDLGIGRAAGTDGLNARALRTVPGGQFGELLSELLAFERGRFPAGHPFSRISVTPDGVALPPIWMLGSSGGSARLAGELGLGYAFAGHFSPVPAPAATGSYAAAFRPSAEFPEPRIILGLNVICAETQEKADEIALPVLYALSHLDPASRRPVLSPEEVRATGFTGQSDSLGPMAQLLVAGTPDVVRAKIEALTDEAGADEAMIMTLAHDPRDRRRSYEILANVFGLTGA